MSTRIAWSAPCQANQHRVTAATEASGAIFSVVADDGGADAVVADDGGADASGNAIEGFIEAMVRGVLA